MARSSTTFVQKYTFIDDLEVKQTEFKLSDIFKLASIGCTNREIAATLGISRDTLEDRAQAALEKGRMACRSSIKRNLFKLMENGSVPAAIWLSKNFCDMVDSMQVDYTKLDLNKLKEEANTLLKELDNEAAH